MITLMYILRVLMRSVKCYANIKSAGSHTQKIQLYRKPSVLVMLDRRKFLVSPSDAQMYRLCDLPTRSIQRNVDRERALAL
uniref:Uncharacterized protein n=1 Tax=Octopus bimaculoides TaxID=37653 RepID=A0A0L8FSK8_OCTBM